MAIGDEVERNDGGDYRLSLKTWIEQNPCVLIRYWLSLDQICHFFSRCCRWKEHCRYRLIRIRNWLQFYKDENHKPEMPLALTDFEALCGFISHEVGDQSQTNDDGEPSGTAGKPILSAIEGPGIDRVMVVVIRRTAPC